MDFEGRATAFSRLCDLPVDAPMRHQRHATGERLKHRRRAPERERLERFTTGEHQDHESARQEFLKQDGCDN